MIQDILPLQFNNHYEEKEIREEDYVLAYDGARVLVKNNQENPVKQQTQNSEYYKTYPFSDFWPARRRP